MNHSLTKLWAVLVACRIIWTLCPQQGYIHPDEFFQSTEIVVGDILNLDVERTWEFNNAQPLRSILFPHLVYGLPVRLLAFLQKLGLFEISPYLLVVVPRLAITALMFAVDAVLWKSSKYLGIKPGLSLCLYASSYVTLTYLTRTLSNTIECLLFAIVLYIVLPKFGSAVHGNSSSSHRSRKRPKSQKLEEQQRPASATDNAGSAKQSRKAAASTKSANAVGPSAVLVATKSGKGKQQQKAKKTKTNPGPNAASHGQQQQQQQQQKHSQKQQQQQQQQQKHSQKQQQQQQQQKHSQKQQQQQQKQKHPQKQQQQKQQKQQKQHQQKKHEQQQRLSNSQKSPQTFVETVSVKTELCVLACCFVAGTFNRPTFPFFAAMPILAWFYCTSRSDPVTLVKNVALFVLYSLPACIVFVCVDTFYYRITPADLLGALDSCIHFGEPASVTLCAWSILTAHVTITPFNFLRYNTQATNLAGHGLHPFYLHVLVNMPLLFHVLYILFFYNVYRCFTRSTKPLTSSCVLSLFVIVPVALLSMFPHQEPRFLVPLLPLLVLVGASVIEQCKWKYVMHLYCAWVISNLALALFYGLLHQGGVIPSLMSAQHNRISPPPASSGVSPFCGSSNTRQDHLVFYHTYMVPKHLLLNRRENVTLVTHDLKGSDMQSLTDLLHELLPDNNNNSTSALVPEACSVRVVLPATLADTFKRTQQCGVQYSCNEERWFAPHLSLEDPPLRLFGRTSSDSDNWWSGRWWSWSVGNVFKDLHLKMLQINKML